MSIERATAPDPYDHLPVFPALTVTSTSFSDGGDLTEAYVYDGWGVNGQNVSPQLSWSGAPETTTSYVVTCFDPDAPTPSGFWHWAIAGIPADVTELAEGAGSGDAALPEGAFHVAGDGGVKGWMGPCPPEGDGKHRYMFAVHAIEGDPLAIDDSVTPAVLSFNAVFQTVARGLTTGLYGH